MTTLGVVSLLFEALEDFAASLEGAVDRLAAWAHGHHCGTCRHCGACGYEQP